MTNPPDDAHALPMQRLTAEERYNRIAEAAYLRAAARGFADGDPLRDWLDAEAMIESSNSTPQESMR